MITSSLFAQSTNYGFSFPSSNNTFLGKTTPGASIGVDQYTGTAQVSVPIFNLKSKQFTIPVSIDYVDGRGVRVEEYASQVGLGWQLNAGGSISRVVRGFPDEQPNGYLGTGTSPAGILTAGQQWGQVVTQNFSSNPSTVPNNLLNQYDCLTGLGLSPYGQPTADGQPDIFSVKTPFFSFQFVFNASGNPVFSNSTGYKIIPTNFINSVSYQSSSFEVIDPSGNQYYFGNTVNSTEQSTDSIFGQVPPPFITTWYLTKIASFNAQDVITFNYLASPSNDVNYSYNYSEIQNSLAQTQVSLNTGKNTVILPKYISSIYSAQGEVDFNYVFNSRQDDPNLPYLTSINTGAYNSLGNNNTTLLQTYNFSYGYFGTPSTDPNVLRLELLGINVTGPTAGTSTPLNIATFGYNTTNNLPNRIWPNGDYWGYCNSTTQGTALSSRYPNAATTQADILDSITTTDGTVWTIGYELNAYNSSGSTVTIGGLRVNKITQTSPTTNENLAKTYQYISNSGVCSGQIYSSLYNSLTFNFNNPNTGAFQSSLTLAGSPYTTQDIVGNFVGYSFVRETEPNGGIVVCNYSNFNDPPDNDLVGNSDFSQQNVTWSVNNYPMMFSSQNLSFKRGLLLNKSIYLANATLATATPLLQTTYKYKAESPVTYDAIGFQSFLLYAILNNTGGSSLARFAYSTPIENYRLYQTIQQDYDQATPGHSITTTTNYNYDVLSDPLNNLRLVDTVTTTDSKLLTRTQITYYPEDINKTASIPMITTSETSAINTMILGNNTNAVIHTVDNRNGTIDQIHNSYSANVNNNVLLSNTAGYSSDPVNTGNTLVKQNFFNYDASTFNLISSNEIGGASSSVLYGYNNALPIAKIINASSTNTVSQVSGSLNGYFSQSATIPITVCNPGALSFSVYASGSFNGASITIYYTVAGPSPQSGSATVSAAGTVLSVNFPASLPGNYTISFTASSSNGTYYPTFYYSGSYSQLSSSYTNEFFYEGFERIGNVYTNAHTGNTCYSGSYSVPFNLPNTRNYLIQWWSYSSGAWNFNQQPYTGPMTLTGQIDDVRVFPKDALMTTYTSNPLVGKTSETDPSGRSTVYQYDGLNRLQTIRDQDNNILKQYDYEYQLLAVPVGNIVESGSFQKTNCPSGYTGNFVTYTVAANTYSSYIGLTDANQKAVNDVNANGQNYANAQSTASACTLIPTLTINGPSSVYSGAPTGSGTISGTAGRTVNVSMGAGGMPGYSLTMTVKSGSTTLGSGVCTTPTSSFSFVLPASGVASYTLSYSGTQGGGSFTVSY